MNSNQLIHCVLQIEKLNSDRSYGDVMTLLGDLDKMDITSEQLETTDVVKVLYRLLKSCKDEDVKKTVKRFLTKWKRQYSNDRQGTKCTEERRNTELLGGVSVAGDGKEGVLKRRENSCSVSEQTCDTRVSAEPLNSLQVSTSQTSVSSDFSSVRSKCVHLLLSAIMSDPSNEDKATTLAKDIEEHIYELHKSSQIKYKACVRSKIANLKNPKTSHLRLSLLSGSLSPDAFARMSVQDMASADLRRLREEYLSRGVNERQLPQGVEGTSTQKIRCKRCGESDCKVTQMSRGALFLPAWVRRSGPDEDAMTFVTCSICGQQWYHSGWICL